MPTYIALVNWTDQGIRTVSAAVERADKRVQRSRGSIGRGSWSITGLVVPTTSLPPSKRQMKKVPPPSSGRSARWGTPGLRCFARSTARRCRGSSIGLDPP